jgi:hypothetical protein
MSTCLKSKFACAFVGALLVASGACGSDGSGAFFGDGGPDAGDASMGGSLGSGRSGGASGGAGDASVSACSSDGDCVGAGLLCNVSLGRCVACLSSVDCAADHDCLGGACVAFTPCSNSLDCPQGDVCNPASGRCVDCVVDADCDEGQTCAGMLCRPSCESDLDCTPLGLLCDKGNGYCVRCLTHVDCPEAEHCNNGACLADVCRAGDTGCQAGGIAICTENGEGYGTTSPCPAGQICVAAPGSASCSSDGTGGSGGSGVTSLIDDMEDGDHRILNVSGRTGYWSAGNDGYGVQTPSPTDTFLPVVTSPARSGSLYAMHTSGSGFIAWGAVVKIDFNNPASGLGGGIGSPGLHDISIYSGLSFWARGSGTLRVEVRTTATVGTAEGGSCTSLCGDHFGSNITLSSSWGLQSVSFAEIRQRNFGTPATFVAANTIGIQFLPMSGTATAASFDYGIDDVSFY